MTLLELNFQRRKVRKDANTLLDKAASESRSLTITEQIQFDALLARIQEFDVQISQRESLRKAVV